MRVPSLHLADLADAAYRPLRIEYDSVSVGQKYAPIELDGIRYRPVEFASNSSTGFQGVIFRREGSSQFIVAFRGTEPKDLADIVTDAQLVARRINLQAADADRLMERRGGMHRPSRWPKPCRPAEQHQPWLEQVEACVAERQQRAAPRQQARC